MEKARKKKVVAPEDKPLNERELRFCSRYLIHLNGKRAAIEAKYAKNSAAVTASKLLIKPNVAKYLQSKSGQRLKRAEVTGQDVLNELAKLGFSNMEDFTDRSAGHLLPDFNNLSRDQMAAVQEISYGKDGMKFKLADKRGSLDLLGRYHKLFTDKVEHSGQIDLSGKTDAELNDIIKGKS